MKKINSKVIGELKQDNRFADWWVSKEIEIPFFDGKKMTITFANFEPEEDKTFLDESDQALENFFKLNTKDKNAITKLVYKNCTDYLEATDFGSYYADVEKRLREIQHEDEIWNFVYPTEIYVQRRHRRDKDIYISIACDCEWDDEHCLQFVFRQGKKLTRVSEQDGHLTEADAWNISDEEDELLSKF